MELSISWVKETEESRMVLEFSDLGEYLYYSLKKNIKERIGLKGVCVNRSELLRSVCSS